MVKRFLAVLLLASFVMQAGASAGPIPQSNVPPLHGVAYALHQRFLDTDLGARLAGSSALQRYEAEHATAPVIPRTSPHSAPPDASTSHNVARVLRMGMPSAFERTHRL